MFIQCTENCFIIEFHYSVANQYYNIQPLELSLMFTETLPDQAFYAITINRPFQLPFWNRHTQAGMAL